jgi:hypothetical protein
VPYANPIILISASGVGKGTWIVEVGFQRVGIEGEAVGGPEQQRVLVGDQGAGIQIDERIGTNAAISRDEGFGLEPGQSDRARPSHVHALVIEKQAAFGFGRETVADITS